MLGASDRAFQLKRGSSGPVKRQVAGCLINRIRTCEPEVFKTFQLKRFSMTLGFRATPAALARVGDGTPAVPRSPITGSVYSCVTAASNRSSFVTSTPNRSDSV